MGVGVPPAPIFGLIISTTNRLIIFKIGWMCIDKLNHTETVLNISFTGLLPCRQHQLEPISRELFPSLFRGLSKCFRNPLVAGELLNIRVYVINHYLEKKPKMFNRVQIR